MSWSRATGFGSKRGLAEHVRVECSLMGHRGQLLALTLLEALLLEGCVDPRPTRGLARALGAPDGATGCGAITYQGCCTGQTLHYCAGGKRVSQLCSPPGTCGWDKFSSLYTCGAADGVDPSGKVPRACPLLDGGQPDAPKPPDASKQDLSGCGGVSYVGCCSGSVLQFCAGGNVLTLSCASSQCGWNPSGGFYDCGTAGQADPSGKHPKTCANPLADARPLHSAADGQEDATSAKDRGDDATRLDARSRDVVPLGDRAQRDGPLRDRSGAEVTGLDLTRLDGVRRDSGLPTTADGCSCAVGPGQGVPLLPGIALLAAASIVLGRRRRR